MFNFFPNQSNPSSWVDRCTCVLSLCCSLHGRKKRELVGKGVSAPQQLGAACHALFGQETLSLSDYVCGLVLLGTMQRLQNEGYRCVEKVEPQASCSAHLAISMLPHAQQQQITSKQISQLPLTASNRPLRLPSLSIAASAAAAAHQQPAIQKGILHKVWRNSTAEVVADNVLEEVPRYKRYALASFGWPMYTWMHRWSGRDLACALAGSFHDRHVM